MPTRVLHPVTPLPQHNLARWTTCPPATAGTADLVHIAQKPNALTSAQRTQAAARCMNILPGPCSSPRSSRHVFALVSPSSMDTPGFVRDSRYAVRVMMGPLGSAWQVQTAPSVAKGRLSVTAEPMIEVGSVGGPTKGGLWCRNLEKRARAGDVTVALLALSSACVPGTSEATRYIVMPVLAKFCPFPLSPLRFTACIVEAPLPPSPLVSSSFRLSVPSPLVCSLTGLPRRLSAHERKFLNFITLSPHCELLITFPCIPRVPCILQIRLCSCPHHT